MDSSLQKESLIPFVDITKRLSDVGVYVPKIFAENLEEGYLLIEDLGNRDLLQILDESNVEHYYGEAIDEILKMQKAETEGLPLYDAAFLHFEMELMEEWYLSKHLGLVLNTEEKVLIDQTIEKILFEVLKQPQGVFVHRDFHSRNLMVTDNDEIAVIDYQDARVGAVTYDLVSLLRDLYIAFDPALVERLALSFRDRKGLDVDDETFLRWFDFMGLQRHIKVLGIFSRLSLRDGKDGYLEDIPQTLRYIVDVGSKYEETRDLADFLRDLTLS
jgi:aminoglycoside/choline kinase family phosphotransferase